MFKDDVRNLVTERPDGSLACNLSAEQRAALQAIQTSSNTQTLTSNIQKEVSSMDIAAAIEARTMRTDTADIEGVYADAIQMTIPGGGVHEYPCAVSKATNIATAGIVEATVNKIYAVCNMTHSDKGLAARNVINTDFSTLFAKPDLANTDRLIKRTTMRDTGLSATVFPQDIRLSNEFVKALQVCINLKANMIAEFLTKLRGADEKTLLTAYRNINRSLLDDIFENQYKIDIGRVDDGDAAEVRDYIAALRDYREGLGNIGAMYLSSDTIEFGLNVRKMTIAPKSIWTNLEKVGRVKKFGSAGSYYVSSNEDSGLGKIPTDSAIVSAHLDEIVAITDHCMALIESEARLENGYDKLDIPALPDIKLTAESTDYATLLGISKDQEARLLEILQERASEFAATVCARRRSAKDNSSLDLIKEMMGRK